jgi:exopolysaccharide production protein ExoF
MDKFRLKLLHKNACWHTVADGLGQILCAFPALSQKAKQLALKARIMRQTILTSILRVAAISLSLILLLGTPIKAEIIGPNDTLQINVMEWDPVVTGGMKAWSGWTTDYIVDADGFVSIPFLGQTEAADITPAELGEMISEQLLGQLALPDRPAVSVSIIERPPVFVSGFVRDTGAIEYRAGMTAREALARAGGVPMLIGATDPLRTKLEAENRLADMIRQQDEMGARSARLRAEVDNLDEITFPALLGDSTEGSVIRAREEQLFQINRDQTKRRLALIDGRVRLLRNEIKSLEQKTLIIDKQLDLAKEQLEATEALAERGLTNQLRLLDSQGRLSALQIQSFDTRSGILEAEQDISFAESERLDAVQGVAAQRVRELQITAADLAETREERRLQERIILILDAVDGAEGALVAHIRRTDGSVLNGLDQYLMPGDFLQIQLKSDGKKSAG